VARLALSALGSVFLVLGIVGVLTPIPFGFVFLVLAMLLLIPTTPGAAQLVRRMRTRSSRFDRIMAAVIRRAPAPYRRILRQTDVDILHRSMY
jgi:UPF0716 family protein affecting phage T7 exclusion